MLWKLVSWLWKMPKIFFERFFKLKKLRSTSRNFSKNLEIVRSVGVARRRFLVMFVDFFADVGVSENIRVGTLIF